MPAIRDVAERAGVSSATVSRVMNGSQAVSEELRRKVLVAAEAINYQSGVGKRTAERIALLYLYRYRKNLASPYEAASYDGMIEGMEESPFDLVVTDIRRDRLAGESISQLFTRKGFAGAIVRSSHEERPIVQELADTGIPFVMLGDHFEDKSGDYTFCFSDSKNATRHAVEHLISLGHTDIAYASCNYPDGDHLDRLEVYSRVMQEHGYYRPELLHVIPPHQLDGAQLARRILAGTDRPTALLVADPLTSMGVLNEAYRLGVRVPEEFSVVGFDDSEMRLMAAPQMTSVVQDTRVLGKEAFEIVARKIEGRPIPPSGGRHECWLAFHDSTAPPPANATRFLPRCARDKGGVTRIETGGATP